MIPDGLWSGCYFYGAGPPSREEKKDYAMELALEVSDGRIGGLGLDAIGPFVVSGGFEASEDPRWGKSYLGPGRHAIDYRGLWDGSRIVGKFRGGFWLSGGFELTPDASATARASAYPSYPSGSWRGAFTHHDGRPPGAMRLSLGFSYGIVVGTGQDPVGFFVIAGRYGPGDEVSWTKHYRARGTRHSVAYFGRWDERSIRGQWTLGMLSGDFEVVPVNDPPS